MSEAACEIRDFNLHFTRAIIPRPDKPLEIVLPVFVLVDGLTPGDSTLDHVDLSLGCAVGIGGEEPLRNGTIARQREVARGFMVDCEIVVDNDDDCEWNQVEVFGSAVLQGTECERRARSTARYCKGEITSEGRLYVEQCPAEEDLTLELEILQPGEDGGKEPGVGVAFPVEARLGGAAGRDVEWDRSCSRGEQEGAIENVRREDGVDLFECVMEIAACDGVPVVVDVAVRVKDGGLECGQTARREMEYCGSGGNRTEEPREACVIGDFNVHYLARQEVVDDQAVVFPAYIFYDRIQPEGAGNDAQIDIKCFLTTSSSETVAGASTNVTEVRAGGKGEVRFGCMFDVENVGANCSTIWVEAAMRVPGNACVNGRITVGSSYKLFSWQWEMFILVRFAGDGGSVEGCERRAVSNRSSCLNKKPATSPPPAGPSPPAPPPPVPPLPEASFPVPPPPTPNPPKPCKISSFKIEFKSTEAESQNGTFKMPFVAVLGRVEPKNSSSIADFDFECFQATGPDTGQLNGTVQTQYSQRRIFGFCAFGDAPSKCNTTLQVQGKVSINEGEDYAGCSKMATDTARICPKQSKRYSSRENKETPPDANSPYKSQEGNEEDDLLTSNYQTVQMGYSNAHIKSQTHPLRGYGYSNRQNIHTYQSEFHECLLNYVQVVFLPWESTDHRLVQVSFDVLASGYRPHYHFTVSCLSNGKKALTEVIQEYRNGFVFMCASNYLGEHYKASVSIDISLSNGVACAHKTVSATTRD